MTFNEKRKTLIEYLLMKVEQSDWHGVSDAANDLRDLESAHKAQGNWLDVTEPSTIGQ